MYYSAIKSRVEDVRSLLIKSNPNFIAAELSSNEISFLLGYGENKIARSETTEDFWKMYKLYMQGEYTCIEFKYYRRGANYPYDYSPDYYFEDEFLQLSALITEPIYHIWEQHIDMGYEVFQNGKRVNSLILGTHGPEAELNGKLIDIPKTKIFLGLIEKYNYGKLLEEYGRIPKDVHSLLSIKSLKTLPFEYVVLIESSIKDAKTLMERLKIS
jgi:hypothetical protein